MKTEKVTKEKAFNNWRPNAVHFTFPNGNAISTVWGYLTYSDNYDWEDGDSTEAFNKFRQSDTVEIMILNAPEKLLKKIHKKFDFGGDTVCGYMSITKWMEVMKLLAK